MLLYAAGEQEFYLERPTDPGGSNHMTETTLLTLVAERLRDVTDVINLQGIHGNLFGAIVDQLELPAFVQGTSELSFPLGGIRFIDSLLELPGLHGPRLEGDIKRQSEVSISLDHSETLSQFC